MITPGPVDATAPAVAPRAEPRQRWRIAFARSADPEGRAHRDVAADWLERLAAQGLPLAGGGRGRQPLSFGAALPAGIAAERELADLVLVERWRIGAVRTAVEASLPPGLRVLDLHDVWLGEPPVAAAVAAADYRVVVAGAAAADLDAGARALLDSPTVPWRRARGSGTATVDIRPLLLDARVSGVVPATLHLRCLVHPERGSGRPDEVVAALADRLGRELAIGELVRERVLLAEELERGAWPTAAENGRREQPLPAV